MSTLSTTNLKNPSSGSNNIVLNTDGTTTVPTLSSTTITGTTIQGTLKQSTVSGPHPLSPAATSIDFTGIPSWVKRVTVMFDGVSTNGSSNLLLRIGAGSILTTGYISNVRYSGATTGVTNGFLVTGVNAATYTTFGMLTIATLGSNQWVQSGTVAPNTTNGNSVSQGQVTLGGTLDRIRITTVNGSDEFDAGSINIMYEG